MTKIYVNKRMAERFYWKGIIADVRQLVSSCVRRLAISFHEIIRVFSNVYVLQVITSG